MLDLSLPRLTDQDSQPFALADDVPCLRGLQREYETWSNRARRLVDELLGRSASSTRHAGLVLTRSGEERLQVFNTSQLKPLYATPEEVARYRQRTQPGTTLPPWTPLNHDFLPPTAAPSEPTNPAEQAEEEEDAKIGKLLSGAGASGDFDLSIVFQHSRQRRATRLVSIGLQNALERFADDRHFSKYLVCRQEVWGWNMDRLKAKIRAMVMQAQSQYGGDNKGKGRAVDTGGIELQLEVLGLEAAPVYHVVWTPIAFLSRRFPTLFESRTALRCLTLLLIGSIAAMLLGMLRNTLLILLTFAVAIGWAGMMWSIRTQAGCVYDTIGTAWCLAPRWERITDADPNWDYETVCQSIKSRTGDAGEVKVEKRGEKWFVRKGIDEEEWVLLHQERFLHLFESTRSQ